MISLQEFFNKTNYTPQRQAVIKKHLEDFQSKYSDKNIYNQSDIDSYTNGSKKLQEDMKIIEKYLRLNFKVIARPETETRKNLPIDKMIDKLLIYLKRKNYAPRTIESYKEELKVFQNFCRETNIEYIDDIDKNILNAYKERLYRKKHSRGAYYDVNIQLALLQRLKLFFDFLVREEYIKINPCIHLTFPKERKKISRNIFTRNEIDDFFSVIDTENIYGFIDRTIFELMYATGIRTGELINLRLKDTNLEDSLITVREGKGYKDRVCFLTIIAKRYLEIYINQVRNDYMKNCKTKTDLVFPTQQSGKLLQKTQLSERVRRWKYIADIKAPVTCYAFRRSFATHLLQEGVNIRYIQRLMGHESIRTTLRYIHITLKDLRQVLVKFHPREKVLSDKKIVFRGTDNGD
ncbi:MAG: hypothetical protein A2096_10080 [Spirochaetes bacterium GWF1_41_5]|nr:MAG: hypothetical protein A2096_10080 [Spirochaetes bacterium GWF1_41_5]HBE02520.1 hypothetical protein [Spirochaetia bacterium]